MRLCSRQGPRFEKRKTMAKKNKNYMRREQFNFPPPLHLELNLFVVILYFLIYIIPMICFSFFCKCEQESLEILFIFT